LARRFGRRTAFQIGTACGVLTGILCCLGVLWGSFLLFNIGTFCTGLYAAAHQAYRFAATDTASDAFKPKAISWVMAGGVGAAFIGPELVIFTKDLWQPYLFAASFVGQSLLAIIAGGVLLLLDLPPPSQHAVQRRGRPLSEIIRQPRLIAAVACGVASYTMMNLVMTSAPLAMVMCNHSTTEATLGIQWHVLGMFVPSFFTGNLITRFGVGRIVAIGLAFLVLSAVISMAGVSLGHFWLGLTLLGVGWNFGFIGATAMVTQCHRPEERTTVQSFNDFLVFGSMAISSFASGTVLASYGWIALNTIVFPTVLVAAVLLVWFAMKDRSRMA
jgi:MFS family permease